MLRLLTTILCVLLCPWLAAAEDALRVVATVPELADWARQLGGERVEVHSLLADAAQLDGHDPGVGDVKSLAGARVLVRFGAGLDPWLDGAVALSRNSELAQIRALAGQSGDPTADPPPQGYPWLDLDRIQTMCRAIAHGLESVDPFPGDHYEGLLNNYLTRLQTARRLLRERAAALAETRFATDHAAWATVAADLGLDRVAACRGASGEPCAAAAMLTWAEGRGIRVLVLSPGAAPGLEALLDGGARLRVLRMSPHLPDEPRLSFLHVYTTNVERLLAALVPAP